MNMMTHPMILIMECHDKGGLVMLTHENLKYMYETYMKLKKPVKEQEYAVPIICHSRKSSIDNSHPSQNT